MDGQVLGNRYELIERIGGGGMALVYKAKCRLLNRFVAVKMLRPEFTNDDEFVKRFRIEAQSAASLSHPNIVSIYDVGHEGDIHYIVMEYVDGVTLKEYISQKGALPWKEAINIAIQVCSAIEHAHKNHIVHRDIKPHNILITKDGIAKVTDFGIARAVSSSTITMVGSTIGSVHYFSPEQARGGYTDEKSDLYSLGIALYEMVTGRVPFDGETPVAVALKHIQEEAQPPIEVNNNIPRGINNIIMKAIRKEQSNRYKTASDMLEDMYRVLRDPSCDVGIDQEDEENAATKRMQAIGTVASVATGTSESMNKKEGYRIREGEEKKEKETKKGDKLTIWLAVVTSLIIIGIFTYIGYSIVIPSLGIGTEQKEFEVKNYEGKNIEDAKDELNKVGIDVKEKRRNDDKIPKDVIISQDIEPGRKIKLGGYNSIKFDISDGPQLVKITDLRKADYRQAEDKLKEMGLVPNTLEEFSDTVATGLVIRTEPGSDESVSPGSEVTIYKSKGPELKPAKVPDLVGKTQTEAQKLLSDAKLVIGNMYPENSSNFVDKIIKQNPAPDTELQEGDAVDIYFETSTNPNVSEPKTSIEPKTLLEPITLSNPEAYGDKIKVLVVITPSDTNKLSILMDEAKSKTDFPLAVPIPVPENGKTRVKVYLDNKLYADFTRE